MVRSKFLFLAVAIVGFSALAYAADDDFKLTLVDHPGQLSWTAEQFRVIQSSAKPGGKEIGIRGQDESGRLSFLGFLFLVPEDAPLTAAKCRDGALGPEKKSNPTLKILETSEIARTGSLPVSMVNYTAKGNDGKPVYMVRGFIATGDICGDLEFYSATPISFADNDLKKIFASYQLNEKYTPQFNDIFVYAEILYKAKMYADAAPVFEKLMLEQKNISGPQAKTMMRVVTDQAGMAYGISGNIAKARAIFEKAVAADPDYPMYYYNLACADAEEKNLAGAKKHLQEAFDRKANIIPGETMPDPTQDDSFLPYRNDKEFWMFVVGLSGK